MSEPTDTSPRRALTAALKAALPKWQVTGYPHEFDRITKPTVMVWTDSLEPASQVGRNRIVATLSLWVLTPVVKPGLADDELEELLLDVLAVLHEQTWLDWTGAERGVLQDTINGYRLTARAVLKIGD